MLPTPNRSSITEYDMRVMDDAEVKQVELRKFGGDPLDDGHGMLQETASDKEVDGGTDDKEEEAHKAHLAKLSQRWFTVEPVLIMYMVGYIALLPIMQQYIYRRLSVDFNITDASNENKSSREICLERVDDSTPMTATEKDFQESVSLWNTVMVVCGLLPTLFVVVIIGPLTDLRGRKFGLVPQVGSAVLAGILITVVVAFDVHIATLPVIQFICGMTGAMPAVMTSTYAYISDINPPEKRFIRILIIEIGLGLGTLVGQIFFGFLIDATGFVAPVFVFTALELATFIYVLFFLPETIRKKPGVQICTRESLMALPRLWFLDKDRMRLITIWISFSLIFFTGLIQDVPNMILTFVFMDPPLCWTALLIGVYNGVSFIMRAIGGMVLMRLLFKRAPDAALQGISLVSGALLFLCLAFATEGWIPFIGAIMGFGTMLLSPVTRAVASRSVPDIQQGALYAGLSLAQMLSMVIGAPVINIIYAHTTPDTRGRIFFVLMAALIIPLALVGIGWYFEKRKQADTTDAFPTRVPICDIGDVATEHQSKPRMGKSSKSSTSEYNDKLYIISDEVQCENTAAY